ncbi:biotin/lipoyl-containing protein [Pseudoponticoccus marisrubri]|uniref:Pyruvate dehydrogenase n=1 Tax=Pseudoponticoccus marisrubri TaxID=1685382 RepID=A0A0W7WIG0_9RHOB|nr:biotin/lipoyl-containing protein [Pseudoponticoccus marisrubri]KUF10411.1 pyruvate dehydrogenase [Pseudoponticoccus marisrubri]
MPHEVIMPALGMAQETGLIVAWHKQAGEAVSTGEVLFEVETDKATMEVEAQADGYLNDVRAGAGDEVPVGGVIALIGETAEDPAPATPAPEPAADAEDALPEGHNVIMPALGMAQDTGMIVAWHKAPGDAVGREDVLFEVETDKSTMEVEAGADGYVAALLAEAGEAAPVGDTIAVITAEKPDAPVQRSLAGAPATPAPEPAPEPAASEPAPPAKPTPKQPPAPARSDGRILASPKARRLALEQGLDLARLVEAGHPQPYHAADIEVLKSLPETAPAAAAGAASASRRLVAELPQEGFTAFADWAADSAGLKDPGALLAGLAAASLSRDTATVAVERPGRTTLYTVPPGPFARIEPAKDGAAPDLRLRDLRHSRVVQVELGAEEVPVLTLTAAGDGLAVTLECPGGALAAADTVTLLTEFAGRMEQPLRHLL